LLCEEDLDDPEPEKRLKEAKDIGDEDSKQIFVGVTSNSKPVVSNVLNRVTPGSCSRR
jgi:hypothetical protein